MEARAAVGRRLGGFYSQISESLTSIGREAGSAIKTAGDQAVKWEDHQQINHGAATLAELTNQKTQEWNDIAKKADPNDPSVAAKFREENLEPSLDKFREAFTTEKSQEWADHHVAQLRQHMFQKTAADMSTLAGEAVKVNFAKTINGLASTARLDPSSLDFALKTAESSIGGIIGSSPTLSATDAGRVKTEGLLKAQEAIVKSAVVGMIEKNPNIDLGAIEKKYGQYITGPEMQMFQKAAKSQAKTDFPQNKQIETYQRQQDEQRVHAAANKNFSDNVSIDPATNRPVIKPEFFKQSLDLARKYPDAPNAATVAKTYLDWGEHQQNLKNEAPRTDPTVKADLMSRMFDPDKPTSKVDVLRAEADGKLSTHDGSVMRALSEEMEKSPIRGPLYQTAVEGAKERVGFTLMADGHERFANAMQEFLPEYLKAKRDGTLKPNALDLRDETSLIRQTLKRWEPSTQEKMQGHILKSMGVSNLGGLNLTGPNSTVTGVTVENKPITLPPLDKREANKVYPTPRGPMKWTGADWVKP